MVLGKLPVTGRPTPLMIVGQGPTALAVGAGGSCLDIFTLIYPYSPPPPSLWETTRYRLKYCLKGPLNPKQPTNQPCTDFQIIRSRFFRDSSLEELFDTVESIRWLVGCFEFMFPNSRSKSHQLL